MSGVLPAAPSRLLLLPRGGTKLEGGRDTAFVATTMPLGSLHWRPESEGGNVYKHRGYTNSPQRVAQILPYEKEGGEERHKAYDEHSNLYLSHCNSFHKVQPV